MKTKSTLQPARKPSGKNAILLTLAALGLCIWSAVAPAAGCTPSTTWNYAGSGSWFDSTKWSSGVPTSGKDAFISYAGTANIDSTGAQACNLFLGYNVTDSGNVSISGGLTLSVVNEVEVGAYGQGKLTMSNGATVTAGLLTIAALTSTSDSAGTVSVDGSTFRIGGRCDVGGDNGNPGGVALMSITNNGTVSASNVHVYKSGTLTGIGTVSTTSGTTVDGTLAPSGTLTIGGNLSFGLFANMRCNVTSTSWDRAEVSGTATLDGKLSVTLNGFFTGDFPLLHASTLSGQFSSYSFTYTGCLSPSIRYDYVNGYVYLHVESTCQ